MAKTIDKLEFFKNEEGKIRYNDICKKCQNKCKQSFRVEILKCPAFERRHK